jgi:hypothetical protein
MAKLFEMKPVQLGLKGLAAGSLLFCAGWMYSKGSAIIKGPEDASLKIVSEHIQKAEELYLLDPDAIEVLGRLEVFVRFFPKEYKKLFDAFLEASKTKQDAYNSKMNATYSFQIRRKYQVVIETVREMRLILEKTLSISLEDFDEIAVDINAKVEQECTDAIQDSY